MPHLGSWHVVQVGLLREAEASRMCATATRDSSDRAPEIRPSIAPTTRKIPARLGASDPCHRYNPWLKKIGMCRRRGSAAGSRSHDRSNLFDRGIVDAEGVSE